ncbi:hypothetical protein ZIOFF_062133 [Zingiber officinale]|uniref:Uncharacterized protein n=1 Tax=Zingiber officinale TaxID=94328 RepID=A0A8J5F4T0_ZINOF|nr:hypothetical protein ZIOFF_062133 [Zingiber officinale]
MQREGETRGRRIVDNYGQRGAKRTRSVPLSPPAGRFRHALLVPLALSLSLSLRPFSPQQAFPASGGAEERGSRGGGKNRLMVIIRKKPLSLRFLKNTPVNYLPNCHDMEKNSPSNGLVASTHREIWVRISVKSKVNAHCSKGLLLGIIRQNPSPSVDLVVPSPRASNSSPNTPVSYLLCPPFRFPIPFPAPTTVVHSVSNPEQLFTNEVHGLGYAIRYLMLLMAYKMSRPVLRTSTMHFNQVSIHGIAALTPAKDIKLLMDGLQLLQMFQLEFTLPESLIAF